MGHLPWAGSWRISSRERLGLLDGGEVSESVSADSESTRGIAPRPFEWALALTLGVVFMPAFSAMSEVWSRLDYYSHGYLVPFAALWAATAQRAVLPTLRIERRPLGGLALAFALVLYGVGLAASIVSLQGVAFILALASALYLARGGAWLRSLSFSISYLIFMIPIPESWINPLIARLQLFVSASAIEIFHWLSVPIYREGNVMHLPGGDTLFVAEACSGITSIVTLVPLAVFLAYFTQRTFLRRLALVATVVPLAMAGNLLRVVFTVWAARDVSVEFATGDLLHNWAGILTYVLGCLALLAIGSLMDLLIPDDKTQ